MPNGLPTGRDAALYWRDTALRQKSSTNGPASEASYSDKNCDVSDFRTYHLPSGAVHENTLVLTRSSGGKALKPTRPRS
jgi:hypothetical protein